MAAQNLEEVISELDGIIASAYDRRNPLGFFPSLYRKVTLKVKEGIDDGLFDDGPRMAALDVAFANRYLEASDLHGRGEEPTESWRVAFEASQNRPLLILQHLFLGINAHINLDLGIAAASIVSDDQIDALRGDFERINLILANLVDEVQRALGQLSPWLALLDTVGGRTDEKFADFSLMAAREAAWSAARRLVSIAPDEREEEVRSMDQQVAGLARLIVRPGSVVRLVIRVIRCSECKDVRRVMRALE